MRWHLLVTIFFLGTFFTLPVISHAATTDSLAGFAWSENIGWVSFNSENDHDPDTAGIQKSAISYGVNVRSDDYLEGHAWSSNIGWISFNRADTGDPPGKYDYSKKGFIAQLQKGSGEIRGWARAISVCPALPCATGDEEGGWDGWIKLYKHPSDAGSSYGVTYNNTTSELEGWAWGDSVVGWMSFNCKNQGVCGTSDYRVTASINRPPSASNLSVVGNYADSDNVCLSPPDHKFSWDFSDLEDSDQTSYELEVDTNSGFASPKVSLSGTTSSTSTLIAVVVSPTNQLGYDETYYWRVKVFDSKGEDSGWVQYADPGASPANTFTTAPHVYPTSLFDFSPTNPSEGEEITFTQTSECYNASNVKGACPAVDGNYAWDFDYETPPFTKDAIGQVVTHMYADTSAHTIALDTTDADGQTCRVENALTPQVPLPEFRETAPTSFFDTVKYFFASFVL